MWGWIMRTSRRSYLKEREEMERRHEERMALMSSIRARMESGTPIEELIDELTRVLEAE